jgi:hypothetical protein
MQLIKSGGTKECSVPFIVVKPDPFRQLLDQDMATPTDSHRLSCYHGTEQGIGSHYDWRPWQDWHMYPIAFPANATRALGPISPSSAGLLEEHNNLSTPEAAFDDGFAAPASNINEYLGFYGNCESMLPRTVPFVLPDNHFGEWNSVFSTTSFPSTLCNLPSTLNTFSRSTLNQTATSEDPGFGALNNSSVRNIGPSAPAKDHLLLIYAGCFPLSFGIIEVTEIYQILMQYHPKTTMCVQSTTSSSKTVCPTRSTAPKAPYCLLRWQHSLEI